MCGEDRNGGHVCKMKRIRNILARSYTTVVALVESSSFCESTYMKDPRREEGRRVPIPYYTLMIIVIMRKEERDEPYF